MVEIAYRADIAEKLNGRVVAITGAARGIGLAYVRAFLQHGAKVVATDRSWNGAEDVRSELARHGDNVIMLDMDVTDDGQIDAAYAAALEKFKTIDVLVNNAAMRQRDLFPPTGRTTTLGTKDSDWVKSFGVNVFGVLKVIRRFIQPMIKQSRGSIVNTVSSGILNHSHGGAYQALRPNSMEMPYMASKAALATMSFYLADDMKANNVAVNTIVPGHAKTTGFEEQNEARFRQGLAIGPQPVVPEHAVPIVLFLATQDAQGTTGRMFDTLTWNLEHGFGGHDAWTDREFSYDALFAGKKS